MNGRIFLMSAVVVAHAAISCAQTQAPTVSPSAPPSTLYRHMLAHVALLEGEAGRMEQQGLGSGGRRTLYQKLIGLSDPDTAALKQVAMACTTAITAIDGRVSAIVSQLRTEGQAEMHGQKPHADHSAEIAQIAALQAQRDQTITDNINGLKVTLSSDGFQRVDNFVQTRFAQQVTVRPLAPLGNP
jgi:hypothetical protein